MNGKLQFILRVLYQTVQGEKSHDMIILLIEFCLILFILGYLRSKIAHGIQIISILVFSSNIPGVILYSLLFLPGVIIHELSHLLTAAILGVRTGNINIFPTEIKEDSVKMGSVMSAESDPIREFFIGLAPLISGIMIITIVTILQFNNNFELNVLNILLLYLIFTVSNTMFVSKEDQRSFWVLPFIGIIIISFYYAFGTQINMLPLINSVSKILTDIDRSLILCTLLDIFFLIFISTVVKITQSISGKRIVYHAK